MPLPIEPKTLHVHAPLDLVIELVLAVARPAWDPDFRR